MYVVTNKVVFLYSIIRGNSIWENQEDVNLLKPYPDGFYLIFNPKNQQRKDYLMVGDSDKDKFAAKAAGIDFLCIKNKHSEK